MKVLDLNGLRSFLNKLKTSFPQLNTMNRFSGLNIFSSPVTVGRATADTHAVQKGYVDNSINTAITNLQTYATTAANNSLSASKAYTDTIITKIKIVTDVPTTANLPVDTMAIRVSN